MSSMSIASFVFILISILSFTYRLSDNKVKILYTCFILSVLSPFLGSISEVYSSELLPLIIMPCCVVLSCLYNEMRSMRVSILALLLMLFSVQNIMSSSSYLFIVLIESAAVLSLLSEDHKDKQIIELSYASFVRVILLISLFVLSSINLIPVANLIEYSFGLGFIFFNSLSFNGKNKIVNNYKYSFLWGFVHYIFIPLVILYKMKQSSRLMIFDDVAIANLCVLTIFLFLTGKILLPFGKKKVINETNLTLVNIPFIVIFLNTSILSYKLLAMIFFVNYVLYKLLKSENNQIISRIYKSLFYCLPLNPFTIYSLIKISQSDEPVLEKSAFLMFFIICWLVSSFRFITKVEYKSRYTYTYYIVLVVLSGAYAYENI